MPFTHQRVKRLRQLVRKRSFRWSEGVLVAEGPELLSVALDSGSPIESVYVAPGGRELAPVAAVVSRAFEDGARVFDLAPGVLEKVADTSTPQPVLAVVAFTPTPIDELAHASMVLVCVDVRDPGNVGTMIRTAGASGAGAVVCCAGTVDPTNPKTVRASAGAIFHTPIVMGADAPSVAATLSRSGFSTVGTMVRDGTDYVDFDWTKRVAIVLGNEASGLGDELARMLDARVTIPMAGRAESLNVAASAAVLCFEAQRQRRSARAPVQGSTMPGMGAASVIQCAGRGGGEG